jgi:pimeloyl-ACP methyl ester carboxylesterase
MPGEANPKSTTENTASLALDLSRRDFVTTASAATGGLALAQGSARAATVHADTANLPPYGNGTLPPGIRSRRIADVNGLTVHILEAGYESPGRPAVLLLHGFPELAYSWRKVMLPLAAAGYYVIAPDQRGYGRTTGWDDSYDADPDPFRILNMVRDAMGLVFALGYREVAAVVGHDAGSPIAAWSALIRPDVFRSVTMMSSPFAGVPSLPFNTTAPRRRVRLKPMTNSTPNSRSSARRANITRTISGPAVPTTTCCTRRKVSTPSSVLTTTTRAPIGKGTSRIPLRRGPPRRWPKSPLIT